MADVMTLKELAQALRVSYLTALAMVREGKIHAVRAGNRYRIPVTAVEAYLAGNQQKK